MNRSVLITGINGFVGTALSNWIETRHPQTKIFGLDELCPSDRAPNFIRDDLTNPRQIAKILKRTRPRFIFHLAGGRMNDPHRLVKANVLTTHHLFVALLGLKNYRPRVIIPGSAAEYGRPRKSAGVIREDHPLKPVNWYGAAKFMQVSLSLNFAKEGCDVVVARIFNICGRGTPATLAPGRFSREILKIERTGASRTLSTGNLSARRDFLDIKDVCSALWAVAEKGQKGQVYNVCSQRAVSMRALLHKMIRLSSLREISVKESKGCPPEDFDVIGSNRKIRKTTHWAPLVPLEQSLLETLRVSA